VIQEGYLGIPGADMRVTHKYVSEKEDFELELAGT
jgi:hypothetical protein